MDSPTVTIQSHWRDYGNREARLTLHLPFSLDRAAVETRALGLLSLVSAVSDAVLTRYSLIWKSTIDEPGTPALTSDCTRYLGLFYRSSDGTQTEAIWIPSPKSFVFEGTGAYTGIRANAANEILAAFLVTNPQNSLVQREGTAFPATFVVGGLRL
jgi:hypothetical protein